jgi:hypothetical protein
VPRAVRVKVRISKQEEEQNKSDTGVLFFHFQIPTHPRSFLFCIFYLFLELGFDVFSVEAALSFKIKLNDDKFCFKQTQMCVYDRVNASVRMLKKNAGLMDLHEALRYGAVKTSSFNSQATPHKHSYIAITEHNLNHPPCSLEACLEKYRILFKDVVMCQIRQKNNNTNAGAMIGLSFRRLCQKCLK